MYNDETVDVQKKNCWCWSIVNRWAIKLYASKVIKQILKINLIVVDQLFLLLIMNGFLLLMRPIESNQHITQSTAIQLGIWKEWIGNIMKQLNYHKICSLKILYKLIERTDTMKRMLWTPLKMLLDMTSFSSNAKVGCIIMIQKKHLNI